MKSLHNNNNIIKSKNQIESFSPVQEIGQLANTQDLSTATGDFRQSKTEQGISKSEPAPIMKKDGIALGKSESDKVLSRMDCPDVGEKRVKNYFHDSKKRIALIKRHRYFHDCERETWARFIDWAFKNYSNDDVWFFTGTYRYCYQSDKRPDEIFNKYILRLKQALITLGYGADLRFVKADELQVRGALHHHALIAGKGLYLLGRRRWEEKWNRLAGIARIGKYIKRSAPYLSKYVSKGSYMSVGGNWQGLHIPDWIYCCKRSCSSDAMASNQIMQERNPVLDELRDISGTDPHRRDEQSESTLMHVSNARSRLRE